MKNNLHVVLLFLLCLFWVDLLFAETPTAQVNVSVVNNAGWPAQYKLALTIPKDHHAYLDKGADNVYIPITFDSNKQLAASGITISRIDQPPRVYDTEVKAQVLRDTGIFTLWLASNGNSISQTTMPLAVKYQLCNDITHVCYRPKTAQVGVTLPVAVINHTGHVTDQAGLTDQLLGLFKNNQNNALVLFGLMLLAGVLSVATPCVYPMLPITSMFIVNRAGGNHSKEKQHALVYMLGMIGTYMVLGLMAGMTGGAFNTIMQSAWVNLAFALFFAFFAIALLGYYELSFMQNEVHELDQKSARIGGLNGTLLMGSVAGLVVSPCVGPIVFALLLQVADNIAAKADALAALNQSLSFWDRFGIASQGALMMGGFGLGVALPFFTVSVVKFKKLPKAGYWMNKIKYAFGFAILYFAYVYFAKGMGVFGVEPVIIRSLAVGMVAVWLAVVHFNVLSLLPRDAQPNEKMHHYCGVVSLLIGGWLIVVGLSRLPFITEVQAQQLACNSPTSQMAGTANTATQQEAGITWYRSFAEAQKVAQQTGKPIFIDFYASWCANCVAFKEETASNGALNQVLRDKAIAVKLIDQEPDFEKFRQAPEHRQLKIGLPYFAILTPDGQVKWSGTDYKATDKMVSVLANSEV